jgi:ATPase family associated with various cellular activities (AAA)
MKNYFGNVFRYVCILPTNIPFATMNLIDKFNHVKYIEEMKYNKNRFMLYSLNRNKESDMNLDKNENHNLIKNANINLNKIPLATQLLSFFILVHTKIKKEIYFCLNSLCIVYGLQIKYLNQESSTWHTYKLVKTFLSHTPFSLQVTDICFPIKPILKDIRHVLIGPVLMSIDFISLSKLKNYLHENFSGFIRWISLIFQTFVLQIDEDGEEVLMKIQEFDVFRQQKPGAVSFFKKKIIYNEDYTFLKFRNLKRKTYFFFRMITLAMLPFIIYRTNQKLHFESGLPKIAYIVSNLNGQKMSNLREKSWENVLKKNTLREFSINSNTDFNCVDFSNLIKPCDCDTTRIINLWNANNLINNCKLTTNHSDLKDKSSIFFIDSLLFDLKKINDANQILQNLEKNNNFQKFLKIYFLQYLNEENISTIVYNYVLFLIQPRDILYKAIDNTDTQYRSTVSDSNLVREKYLLINKIHNLQYKYFHINISLLQKYFQNKYFQNLRKMIFSSLSKISLHKYITTTFTNFLYKSKNHWKYNVEENNFLKKETQENAISHLSFVHKVSGKDNVYRNIFIVLIETYLKNLIDISQHVILNWLDISLGISKNSFEGLHFQYKYINSLVHNNEKILFSRNKEFHLESEILVPDVHILSNLYNDINNIHLVKSSFHPSQDNYLVNQLEINLLKKPLFIQKWQLLDSLHSISTRNWKPDIIDNVHHKMMNIIPLFYSNFCNKIKFLDKSANFQKLSLRHERLQNFRKNLHETIYHEQDQIGLTCDQSIQCFNSSNLVDSEVSNTNNVYPQIVLNGESQLLLINSISYIGEKSLFANFRLLYTLNDKNLPGEIYLLNSSHLWQSLVEIFKKNVKLNQSFGINNDIILNKKNAERIFNSKKEPQILSGSSKKSIFNEYIYNQIQIIRQYSVWFFTLEWWSLVNISSKKILLIIWQDILDSIYSSILPIKRYLFNKSNVFDNKLYKYKTVKDDNLAYQGIRHINIMIFEKLQKSLYNVPLSIWENTGFSSFRIYVKSYLASVSSFMAYYGFSLLLGGSSIILWMTFEKVRDLTHLSWNTELDILVLANIHANTNPMLTSYSKNKKNQLREQYNLSFLKWSAWLRLLFSNQIGSKWQNIWLYNRSTLDMYGDRRGLAFELMVGETSFLGLNLSNLDEKFPHNIGYESIKQEGLDYLKQLTHTHYKWYNNENRNLIHNQRFISFAFYKTHSASVDSWQIDNNLGLVQQQYLPISLQLSDLYSRAILLIGQKDTGKSYLVKSLAADANLPLIYIPINKLIDVLEFEESTLESDSSLYFLRENILKFNTISSFIKTMGPCIIWMPTIENIHNSWNYTSTTREHCTLLILRFLLKDITTTLANYKDIMFLASCEDTSYLDPGFISVKRFNRFINLRIPSNVRRPQIFANFLKNHNLHIKSKVCWYSEFSNSTMGFNLRDLAAFANQAFLISLDKNKKSLELDDIRLVLYRGLRANENSSKESLSQDFGKLQYQIGRAIVQTTLVRPHPMIPLRSRYDLWKPRFYYLSKAYLQPDFSESTVTQFDILPHILNCLAGSAARDAWLLLNKTTLKEDSFYLNTEISHDLDLAVNLFESIFKEFAYLDICNFANKNTTFVPEFKKIQNFVILDQGNDVAKKAFDVFQTELDLTPSTEDTLSQRYLEYLSFDIGWSSRVERLSLSRNILFDLLKKVDEPLSLFSYLRYFGRILSNDMLLEQQRSYAGIYHRAWDMMKSQIPKDLDYAFYGMLSKQRITTMGLPVLSNEFIEYEPPENDLLLFGGRPVWNPAATFLRNLVFRQRQLFANEELLSILYLAYQSQRSRPSIGKINRRKEVWTPDAYLETLAMKNNLEEDSEQKTRVKLTQTFNMFKRLAHANATFRRPQAEVPDNSEMPFVKPFIAPNRFSRFSFTEDIFYQQNLLKEDDAKLQELLTYGSILESYHYLLKLFVRHQYLFKSITNTLLKEGVLFEEDLQKMIHSCLNSNFDH